MPWNAYVKPLRVVWRYWIFSDKDLKPYYLKSVNFQYLQNFIFTHNKLTKLNKEKYSTKFR